MRKTFFTTVVVALSLAVAGIQTAAAQAFSGRDLPDRPRVSVSYYKTLPGKQDEWLALYKKWHRPIMDYQIKEGLTLSSTVYAPTNHSPGQPWDFAIINVAPAPSKAPKAKLQRGQVIKQLFPDIEAYVAGERHRWELTVDHWDEGLLEIDVATDTPSVYYPIIDGKIVK